jgi:hypothetical protein
MLPSETSWLIAGKRRESVTRTRPSLTATDTPNFFKRTPNLGSNHRSFHVTSLQHEGPIEITCHIEEGLTR